MSTKYLGEKLTREALRAVLQLLKGAQRYTSREITNILASDYPPSTIRPILYRLRDVGDVRGGAYQGYSLTQKGLNKLQKLEVKQLQQLEAWDQKWRLVIYDIPESQRKARDTIRLLIKKLGFKQVQQSLWAHPLPCLEEFEKIRKAYGIKDRLILVETPHSVEFDKLLKAFQTIYPSLKC